MTPPNALPEFIKALPAPDVEMEGLNASMVTGDALVLFFTLDRRHDTPEHTHSDEWGVILEGECDITIDGNTTKYRRGDTYFVPAGTPHSVVSYAGLSAIEVFADPNRFVARKESSQT
jgi:quercetin dioxygenase-like cupin family protein